jgi:WD40 repeat protein
MQGEIARGGLGRIIQAHDQRLRRPVALKQLLRPRATDEARFFREALLTARLEHPSIIPVHDAGIAHDGSPFYAMKLVGGRSLAAALSEKKTLNERMTLLSHVINVCEALAYAHSQGIIHRDLKPHNVLVGPFGETVVIDWGLAKDLNENNSQRSSQQKLIAIPQSPETADTTLSGPKSEPNLIRTDRGPESEPNGIRSLDSRQARRQNGNNEGTPNFTPGLHATPRSEDISSPDLTVEGSILGTPSYMPPEQAKGESVDARADVYSLGAILYHLLVGNAPYQGKNSTDTIRQLLMGPPPDIRKLQPKIPKDLLAIVEKAMQRDLALRYPSAKELAEDIKKFQTGQLVSAYQYSNTERVKRFLSKYKLVVSISAVLLCALFALGVFTYVSIIDERNQAEAARDEAILRADEALLGQASLALDSSPSRAMTLLSQISNKYPKTSSMRLLAADAISRGIPKIVKLNGADIIEIAFRPRSEQFVALHQGGAITITDIFTWQTRPLFDVPRTYGLTFSPDGSRLAVFGADAFHLYSMTEREAPQVLRAHSDRVTTVAFSADGKRMASAGQDRTIFLWELSCKRPPCGDPIRLEKHPSTIYTVVFSPDGKHLASAGRDGALFLWDLTQPTPTPRALVDHRSNVVQLQFFSDSKSLISAGRDGKVRIWNTESAMLTDSFEPPQYGASDFALSPDEKRILVGSSSGFLWLWNLPCEETLVPGDIDVLKRCNTQRLLGKHEKPIDHVAFFGDRTRGISFSFGGELSIWDLNTGSHRGLKTSSRRAFLSPGQDFLLTTVSGGLSVWPLQEASSSQNYDVKKGSPLAFSKDMTKLGYSNAARFSIYDLVTKENTYLPGHTDIVWAAAFSPDNKRAVSAGQDKTIRIWDLSTKEATVLTGHENEIRGLSFSPDGKLLASASWDKTVRLWDVSTPKPKLMHTLRGHASFVRTVTFSPDGKTLASGGTDGQIILWDMASYEPTLFHEGLGSLALLRFSPDGTVIAASNSDGGFWLFPREGGEGRRLVGHSYNVIAVAFSPDGQSLASTDATHEIRIWDLLRWREPTEDLKNRVLLGHARAVNALGFSLDGLSLLSASEDGSIRSWPDDLPRDPQKLREFILSVVNSQ